ncbi:MAG TPA: arylsulfatase [Bryobacteraceae bacterium]|nr:arylsulfatase [Bryobacteraceae bacterium]
MTLSRRAFLSVASSAAAVKAQGSRPPNFLVILADDMGYSDAGCYGGEIRTPNIDALAKDGVRFTQGYSTARCGPSRSCLTTGYYAQQTASDVMTAGRIPAWTRFVPQYLKSAGYRSYHSGKWHIRFRPLSGTSFDKSYVVSDQMRTFGPRQHFEDDQPLPGGGRDYYASINIADHAVRCLQDHARNDAGKPFFHYLAFTAPHFPLHALEKDIREYEAQFSEGWDAIREKRHSRMRRMGLVNCALSGLEPDIKPDWNLTEEELRTRVGPGEVGRAVPWSSLTQEQKELQRIKMAIHAAMITRMDAEIGRVVAQLKAMNEFDNTLVVFVSDNGASAEQMIRGDGHDPNQPAGSAMTHLCLGPGWSSAANTPFRRHKAWVHEGGISSPWIMHWPAGRLATGKLVHTPCHLIDVLPTVLELSGAEPRIAEDAPPLPGRSLAAAMRTGASIARDHLYFHHNNNRALRAGNWKLVSAGKDGPWELYDMKKDRSEMHNLAGSSPAIAAQLARKWQSTEDGYVQGRESAKSYRADAPELQPLGRAAAR